MKNLLKPLAESFSFQLTAAGTDPGILKKYWSRNNNIDNFN